MISEERKKKMICTTHTGRNGEEMTCCLVPFPYIYFDTCKVKTGSTAFFHDKKEYGKTNIPHPGFFCAPMFFDIYAIGASIMSKINDDDTIKLDKAVLTVYLATFRMFQLPFKFAKFDNLNKAIKKKLCDTTDEAIKRYQEERYAEAEENTIPIDRDGIPLRIVSQLDYYIGLDLHGETLAEEAEIIVAMIGDRWVPFL